MLRKFGNVENPSAETLKLVSVLQVTELEIHFVQYYPPVLLI